jgi:hypothetical protein
MFEVSGFSGARYRYERGAFDFAGAPPKNGADMEERDTNLKIPGTSKNQLSSIATSSNRCGRQSRLVPATPRGFSVFEGLIKRFSITEARCIGRMFQSTKGKERRLRRHTNVDAKTRLAFGMPLPSRGSVEFFNTKQIHHTSSQPVSQASQQPFGRPSRLPLPSQVVSVHEFRAA